MKKLLFLTALLSIVFTMHGVQSPAERYGSFAIIGDSYSTFMGFTDPLGNAQWYPHAGNAMASVEQTWWKLFERESGVELVHNNSFSGSTICTHSWNNSTDLVNSFVGRVANLREAGLIIVEGATNDNNAGSALGSYVWSDFTDAHKRTFRGGTAYVIDYLQKKYPQAQLLFMLNSGLRADINESVQTVCDHYGVPVLKLHDITKIEEHPDVAGMIAIKEQLMEMLCGMNGIEYISESGKVAVDERDAADVMVNKKMRGGAWNSVCFPFAMSESQIADVFGAGTRVQVYGSYADGLLSMRETDCIEANTPCIVMPESDVALPFIVENVDLKSAEAVVIGDDECSFMGLYEPYSAYKRGEKRYAFSYRGTLSSSDKTTVKYPPLSAAIRTANSVALEVGLESYVPDRLPALNAGGLFSPVHPCEPVATAVPLVVADPFLSVWSHDGTLASGATRHLTGDVNALEGYMEVDGVLYRLIGAGSADAVKIMMGVSTPAEVAVQTGCSVTATQTYCDFEAGGVALSLLFSSPMLVTDASSFQAAVNYVSYQTRSLDGKPHEVRVHIAASADLVRRTSSESMYYTVDNTEGVAFGRLGCSQQNLLEGNRSNWGYLMMMADADRGQKVTATNKYLVFTDDLGESESEAGYTLIGRDENAMAVGFGYARFPAPWVRSYDSFQHVMMSYAAEVNGRLQACRDFDELIYSDAMQSGGEEYARICATAYRQVTGACKQGLSDTGKTLLYNVDAGDSWQTSQAEQLFAAAPLFLAYNPSLAYSLYETVPDYISMFPGFSSPFGNAPHHLGTWPVMAGSNLDHGVDATTDICILAGAAVKCGMDADDISAYSYAYLTSLCRYLDLFTLPQYVANFPNEGSADGSIRNSANLRLKSVLAMALVADIAAARGKSADEVYYREMAERWEEIFRTTYASGDHYRHGESVEWGQKYPLFYDMALGLDIFSDVRATELAYYATVDTGEFGLPLDGRSPATAKLSATMLTAAMAGDDFSRYFSPVAGYIGHPSSLAPVANRYDCQTAAPAGGAGSASLGSLWAKVLLHRLSTGGSSVGAVSADRVEDYPSGIYDLQGRSLSGNGNLSPGIYIVNGRKTLVR